MKDGRKTSEFALVVSWCCYCGIAVALLLALALSGDWKSVAAASPVVMTLLYMSGVQGNNYAENRYRLKSSQPGEAPEQRGAIGFGRDKSR